MDSINGDLNELFGNNLNNSYISYYYYYYFHNDFHNDFHPLVHAKQYMEVHKFVTTYVLMAIILVSVVGNLFTIFVLSRNRVRQFPTSIFMISLACSDIYINITSSLQKWLMVNGYIQYGYSLIDCLLRNFLRTQKVTSPLMCVYIATERLVCVLAPHRVKDIFTTIVVKCMAVVVWTLGFTMTFLTTFFLEYIEFPKFKSCILNEHRFIYQPGLLCCNVCSTNRKGNLHLFDSYLHDNHCSSSVHTETIVEMG